MGEKVSVLVDRAALHRHAVPDRGNGLVEPRRAIDDEELGTRQPAFDEIAEHRAPGLGALAAHAPDREQHFLAICTHAKDNEQRDRGRLAVEPHPNDGAVEDQAHDRLSSQRAAVPGIPIAFDLAPRPAHRVFADRPAKQGRQGAAHPPGIGAGEIAARDQRVGGQRAPLIGPQRLALPFRRPALGRGQPGARHRDLDRPERARQRPRPAAVTVTRDAGSCLVAGHLASFVTRPRQGGIKLAADQLFDELARPNPHLALDRVKPVVEKINSRLSRRQQGNGLRGKLVHGVVSSPTLQRRMIRG
ncbi:hypothetical protein BL313_11685 [Staphylococcus hominis]|nr:hypothetical protein BL313_11685 [Staphylococcus hominis]